MIPGVMGHVMPMSEIEKIMAEAAEKIRREGYAAGWRDCAALVAKTVAEAAPGTCRRPLATDKTERIQNERRFTPAGNAPTVGTTPHYVFSDRRKPGMIGAEVVAAVHADGHNVAEASIRTTLVRLDKRHLIVNRHKKWFPM